MPIRAATREDIAAMAQLALATPSAAIWTEAQYQEMFNPAAAVLRHAVIFEEAISIVGFAVARAGADDWELENIVVRSNAQRRGRGAELLSAVIEQARIEGAKYFRLEVRESNLAARRLYEKCGFRVEGRRRGYYRDPAEDAILYRRDMTIAPTSVQVRSLKKNC